MSQSMVARSDICSTYCIRLSPGRCYVLISAGKTNADKRKQPRQKCTRLTRNETD